MKNLLLPETKIEIEVSDRVIYHDDGTVNSLVTHTTELEEKYRVKIQKERFYVRFFEQSPLAKPFHKFAHRHQIEIDKGRAIFITHPFYKDLPESLNQGATLNVHTFILDILGKHEKSFLGAMKKPTYYFN